MKRPDEIKKGLECCSNVNFVCNEECPYYKSLSEGEDCCLIKNADALALIQQLQAENAEKEQRIRQLERSYSFAADLADGLKAATVKQEQEIYALVERNRQLEAQNAELSGKIGQLEAERDAAVADLKYVAVCETCKEFRRSALTEPCLHCTKYGLLDSENKYEWRGVHKED